MSTNTVTPNPTVQAVQETVVPKPEVTINTPAPEIAAANTASQATPTPGQPRDDSGRFVSPSQTTPAAPATEYQLAELPGGRLKVTYATGETFEGTPQEVIAKTAQSHVQTKRWAQQQRQPEPAPVLAPPAPAPAVDPAETAAMDYVANMVAKKLGLNSADELVQRFSNVNQTTEQYAAQSLAASFFAAAPDFNPTDENSSKLTEVIEKAGMPINLDTLQMAHAYCLKTGVYQPAVKTAAIATPQTPPPMISSQSPQQGGGDLDVNVNMSAEEIKRRWDLAKAQAGVQ